MSIMDHVSLYLITDDKRSAGRPVEQIVEEAVAGGVRLVQYRPWMISDTDFVTKAMALRRITRKAGCMLLLNARPDVAIQVGADGVHVGRSSMAVPAARRRLIDSGVIGYSAHSPEEAKKAEEDGADFITYSPVFETTSSSKPRPALGVDAVVEISKQISIPVFPLGGIGVEQAAALKSAGLPRAAVVSSITESDDVEKAARDLIAALQSDK